MQESGFQCISEVVGILVTRMATAVMNNYEVKIKWENNMLAKEKNSLSAAYRGVDVSRQIGV